MLIRQFDRKNAAFVEAGNVPLPTSGWIRAIRTLLNMSFQQLGNRMNITLQAVKGIEQREKDGAVTIKTMQEVARAMDLKFIYGFVPIDGSIEKLIERKAYEAARKIVGRTNASMKLEDQANSKARLEEAVDELAMEIKKEVPKYLWD